MKIFDNTDHLNISDTTDHNETSISYYHITVWCEKKNLPSVLLL